MVPCHSSQGKLILSDPSVECSVSAMVTVLTRICSDRQSLSFGCSQGSHDKYNKPSLCWRHELALDMLCKNISVHQTLHIYRLLQIFWTVLHTVSCPDPSKVCSSK